MPGVSYRTRRERAENEVRKGSLAEAATRMGLKDGEDASQAKVGSVERSLRSFIHSVCLEPGTGAEAVMEIAWETEPLWCNGHHLLATTAYTTFKK